MYERAKSAIGNHFMPSLVNLTYRLIETANERAECVVVATVAHTRGSTPQRRGAKMLFSKTARLWELLEAAASKLKLGGSSRGVALKKSRCTAFTNSRGSERREWFAGERWKSL